VPTKNPFAVTVPVPEKLFEPKEYEAGVETVQFVEPGAQLGSSVSPGP